MVAISTKVMERIHNCGPVDTDGLINCGRNATKNTIPFGFSAVTSQVVPNSFHLESGILVGLSVAMAVVLVSNNRMPR